MGRRIKEFAAMVAIGDGVLALLAPRRHILLWRIGPEEYRAAMERIAGRPGLVRALAAAEIGVGLLLALRQYGGAR